LSVKKDYDKGIADFTEAIRLDPKDSKAFNDRGSTWSVQKEFDKAIKDYEEAFRLAPKDPSAAYNKACACALQGRTALAIEQLRNAIEQGFRNFGHIATDSDLDSIRNDERFKALIAKHTK